MPKYVDDVLFQAVDYADLERKLEKFFDKCREMSKKEFKAATRVSFGGCVIDTTGMK